MEETDQHDTQIQSKVTPKKRKHHQIAVFDQMSQNKNESIQEKQMMEGCTSDFIFSVWAYDGSY